MPLRSRAQFLNVIESVISGMARATIRNRDYSTVGATQAAIIRYIDDQQRFPGKPTYRGPVHLATGASAERTSGAQ